MPCDLILDSFPLLRGTPARARSLQACPTVWVDGELYPPAAYSTETITVIIVCYLGRVGIPSSHYTLFFCFHLHPDRPLDTSHLCPHPHPGSERFLMSSRITRSAARVAADSLPSTGSGPSPANAAAGSASNRKRKAPARRDRSVDAPEQSNPSSPPRKAKRQRRATPPRAAQSPATTRRGTRNRPAMSQSG